MSTPVEMTASVVPLPPPNDTPPHRTGGVARDDVAESTDREVVTDAASVRAKEVSMATDEVQTAPNDPARGTRPTIDLMV